jgi:hypothetical protein
MAGLWRTTNKEFAERNSLAAHGMDGRDKGYEIEHRITFGLIV